MGKIEFLCCRDRLAGTVLLRGVSLYPEEWKLLLERVHHLVGVSAWSDPQMLERRFTQALWVNIAALRLHEGAGRLWSCYIHLLHMCPIVPIVSYSMFGPDIALSAFYNALRQVSKSGEVWCEGARIFMDPFCSHFNLLNASKCLNFAVFLTPQYGDSLIEVRAWSWSYG